MKATTTFLALSITGATFAAPAADPEAQAGICVVGVKSPCNGDAWDGTPIGQDWRGQPIDKSRSRFSIGQEERSVDEKRDADPQEAVPVIILTQEKKRDLVEKREADPLFGTLLTIGSLGWAAADYFLGDEEKKRDLVEQRDAASQDVIPIIVLSQEEKRDLVEKREADPLFGTLLTIGSLGWAAADYFLGDEEKRDVIKKRDAVPRDAIPVIVLTQEEKRDLVEKREAEPWLGTALSLWWAADTVDELITGDKKKRDADPQDAIPVIILTQEEKRDLVEKREAEPWLGTALSLWWAADTVDELITGDKKRDVVEKREAEAEPWLGTALSLWWAADTVDELITGDKKKRDADADAQEAIPVIFLTQEEKRDAEAARSSKEDFPFGLNPKDFEGQFAELCVMPCGCNSACRRKPRHAARFA